MLIVNLKPTETEQRKSDLLKCREILNSLTERELSSVAGAWEVPVYKLGHEINDLVCALTLLINRKGG